MKTETLNWFAAGRTWKIEGVPFEKSRKGEPMLSLETAEKLKDLIINEICTSTAQLSGEELKFLCEATATKNKEVADYLGKSEGAISQWRNKKQLDVLESFYLKKLFWERRFFRGEKDRRKNARTLIEIAMQEAAERAAKARAENFIDRNFQIKKRA